jgi:hypothetical protein
MNVRDYEFVNAIAYILRDYDDDFTFGVERYDEDDDETWVDFNDLSFPERYLFEDDMDVYELIYEYDFYFQKEKKIKSVVFFVSDDAKLSNIYKRYLEEGIDFLIPLINYVRNQRDIEEKDDESLNQHIIHLTHLNNNEQLESLVVLSKLNN